MLGKLIKYEFKATGRSILPLYLALLVLSIINKIFWGTEGLRSGGTANFGSVGRFAGVITMILYGFIFMAALVMTVVIIIQRFYKNLLKDEGYLMNTLPVTPQMNIASKLITAIIWLVICGVISLVSIFILTYYPGMMTMIFSDMGNIFELGINELGATFFLYSLECITLMILGTAMSILMVYASITIGHLANKNKILLSIAAFIGLNTLLNILATFGMIGISSIYSSGAFPDNRPHVVMTLMNASEKTTVTNLDIQIILIVMILVIAALSAGFLYISSYIMKNKLNLE